MEFQICLHFCVSFLGRKKKQLRDLGEQIYKVKLIITIGEALFSNHCPSPPSYPLCPHFFVCCDSICLASKWEATDPCRCARSHIEFNKQMFAQPRFTSTLSFSESRPRGNRLEQHKGGDQKNRAENLTALMLWTREWAQGGWHGEKCTEQNFTGFLFSFWLIQRLLCVRYSKSSILPHPGGRSSELHAWVVLHLTAAIQ